MWNPSRSSPCLAVTALVLLTIYRLTPALDRALDTPEPASPPPSDSASAASAHIMVAGRVQGVYFRDGTVRQARAQGLVGWVRNLRDGRVQIFAQGPAPNVRRTAGAGSLTHSF